MPGSLAGILPVIILLAVLLAAVPAHAQRKSDIGIFTGVSGYLGDLNSDIPVFTAAPPAIGPIFRYNFNMRNSLRAHGIIYDLRGSGSIYSNLGPVMSEFNASFVDLGLDFEFNWWPYKSSFRKTPVTPYVSAGLGYGIYRGSGAKDGAPIGYNPSHLYLPFGAGVKVNLGERLSGGAEASFRKTFSDLVDGSVNMGGAEVESLVGNNDWYMFSGIFLTYKIFNFREECPTYD